MSDAVLTLEALTGNRDDTKGKKRTAQRGGDTNEGSGEIGLMLITGCGHAPRVTEYVCAEPLFLGRPGGVGRGRLRASGHNICINRNTDLVVCVFLI